MNPAVALVVPTLNEVERLPGFLHSISRQTVPFKEIVLSDGGSTDDAISTAERSGVKVLTGPPGRGAQIAAGIEVTSSPIILVLHADSRCDFRTVEAIATHFQRLPDSPGGCLGHRFDERNWLLRLVEWADRRRARRGMSYGDQGQFFRREALTKVGGFPRQPLMEDLELSRRLQQLGPLAYLDLPVGSSTRGFKQKGVLRTILRNARLRREYFHGHASPEELYRRYYPANAATRVKTSSRSSVSPETNSVAMRSE